MKISTRFSFITIPINTMMLCVALIISQFTFSQGASITTLNGAAYQASTGANINETFINVNGWTGSADFPDSSTYTLVWGDNSVNTDNNFVLATNNTFSVAGTDFEFQATDVFVRRNTSITPGEKDVIWAEYAVVPPTADGSTLRYRADYLNSIEQSFNSLVVNIGSDETFVNTGGIHFSNIERVDFVFFYSSFNPNTS